MWWMKKFRKRKIQSILIVAVVTLCTTLISGSTVILASLKSVYEDLATQTNAPDLKVYSRTNYSDFDYRTALESTNDTERIEEISAVSITTLKCNGEKNDVFLDICEMNEAVYGDVRIIDGNLAEIYDGYVEENPENIGADNEVNVNEDYQCDACALSEAVANQIDAKVGDVIIAQVNGKQYNYIIVATFAEIYSAAPQYTCDMLVDQIIPDVEIKPVYAVYLKPGVTNKQLIQDYTENNDGIMNGYFRPQSDCIMNAEMTELILGGILLGISTIVFFAILLIIGYIIKNCFRVDKKTIAVYKTIGYNNHQIRGIYMTFYMFLIITGSILGGLGSPILTNSFIRDVYENIGATGGATGIVQIVTCAFIIDAVSFFMLLNETGRIARMKPVEILNGSDEGRGKRKNRKDRKNKYSFSPAAMALRMIQRDKKNTCLLLVTCVLNIFIVNLSIVCLQNVDYIRGELNYYWLGIDKHDVTIENNGITDERFYEICDEIKKDSEVDYAIRRNLDRGFAIPYHRSTSAYVYETYENMDAPLIEGRNPIYDNEVVIGNIYKEELGVEVGDYVTIQLDATHRKDLLIVGVYQGLYNMGYVFKVRGDLLLNNDIDFSYWQCSITLKNEDDKEAYMQKLEDRYQDEIKVIDRYDLYDFIMDVVCDPQVAALRPFVIVTILIGTLNAFYIIYASNIEKRKKYAIYKSIGYSASHIMKMNYWYVFMIVLVSIVIAVPTFLLLFPKIMVLAMSSFGFAEYRMVIKPFTMVVINAGMMVVFLLSTVIAGADIRKNYIAQIMNE